MKNVIENNFSIARVIFIARIHPQTQAHFAMDVFTAVTLGVTLRRDRTHTHRARAFVA